MITITGYQHVEKLYESTTVLVVRGKQIEPGRQVILKLPRNPYPTSRELAFFRREFNIGSTLKTPGVIDFYGLEKYQNGIMIILEDIGGNSLDRIMARCRPSLDQTLELSVKIADALGQIHQKNIIHKDINPSNIIWNSGNGQLKIIDFGMASELPRENPEIRSPNVIEGTLAYISPEQTGRMNRPMDYRTDLYSLGATLYEMTTGIRPFVTDDPLEMIHCHIARPPVRPDKRDPEIPQAVSDIIMKLLSKNAEDRYQTAGGLKKDLYACLEQLRGENTIAPFPIGRHDIPDRFQVPRKLYGREQETEALLTVFDRVCLGGKEIMTVSGQPGIGKSVVVHEIQKPVVAHRGFFVSGKFDQLERNIPYRAIIQAFRQLVGQVLTESESQVKRWRKKLVGAMGANGQAVVDIIPELEMLIGPQPELENLPSVKTQNRFNHVFQNFIGVFAKKNHPLVLFLDDLQWADSASMKLVELLMENEDLEYLFILGAYRDTDMHPGHPVMLTLSAFKKTGQTVHALHIAPLPLSDVQRFVADTVHAESGQAFSLAEAVYLRTQGNPFFTILFLQSLYEKEGIAFNAGTGSWTWDTSQISTLDLPEDVVDLMAGKIRDLPENTGEVLKRAACIGNRFELGMLAIVCKKPLAETGEDLWAAMQQGIVLPIGDEYKLLPSLNNNSDAIEDRRISESIAYHFIHDRVQQAAYSLIPESQRKQTHLDIGRLLLNDLEGGARDEKIFNIVNQFNFAPDLLNDPAERLQLAELNLNAGKRAMTSNAWESALAYLNHGRQMMSEDGWETSYPLMLELHTLAANAAYLSGHFSEMENIVSTGIRHAKHLHDAISFYETRIQCFFAQNRPLDVVMEGLRILRQLGHRFPSKPNDLHALMELIGIRRMMIGRSIESLYNTPDMHDRNVHNVFRILPHIGSSSYRALPKLLPLVVFRGVKLFLKHGNASESAFFIAAYAMILCGALDRIDLGSQFGELALSLNERPIGRRFKARTCYLVEGFVRHWKRHIRDTLPPLVESYRLGMETGDVEFGTGSAHLKCAYRFFAGDPLDDVIPDTAECSRLIAHHKQTITLNYNEILHQALINYVQPEGDPIRLCGRVYDEDDMIPVHMKAQDETSLYVVYVYKLMLACTFERWEDAVAHADEVARYDDFAVGLFYVPCRMFYEALARLVVLPNRSVSEKKRFEKRIRVILKKLKLWADSAPMNHSHRYLLIAAETERTHGRYGNAADLFDQAIRKAREYRFLQDESLCLERYAMSWYERNKPEIARLYLEKAYYSYQVWGASEKVRRLEKNYPEVLARLRDVPEPMSKSTTSSSMRGTLAKSLDIDAVLKTSQAISSEIELKRMFSNLIRIMIECAGAQNGALLLSRSGALFIEAQGTVDSTEVLQSIPLSSVVGTSHTGLPERIVHYVARTKEALVLDDAALDRRFEKDPYISENSLKSVLCMPVMHHGSLTGILYLENNLTSAAFTPQRFELLRLLSSQAAISIENALLYATLEEKIAERTRELAEAQHTIIQLEKEATEIQMAGGFAHEMRNALAGAQKLLGKVFDIDNGERRTLCYRNAQLLTDIYRVLEEHLEPSHLEALTDPISRINENDATLDEIVIRAEKRMKRALAIVDEIMDYSRIGKASPGEKPVSLARIIEAMIRDESQEEFNDLGFRIRYTAEAPTAILGDEQHYYSIIKNLLLNARDAAVNMTDPERKKIDIRLTENSGTQTLAIRDYGVGIEADAMKHIFDPFYTTKPHTGTGLGLGVVSKLTALYNGSIDVISQPGQGTTFTLTFPIHQES